MSMRRTCKRNHRTGIPTCFAVVDTETHPVPSTQVPGATCHLLRCGVARYWREACGVQRSEERFFFADANAFWGWLFSKSQPRKTLWLWAHNLGFDLTALGFWRLLETGEVSFGRPARASPPGAETLYTRQGWSGCIVTGDPPTIVSCRTKDGRSIRMVDTMNFFPTSLAQLGALVGMEKLSIPGEVGDDDSWREYCERDVNITTEVVRTITRTVRMLDAGNLRTTVAGQAYACWRHKEDVAQVAFDDNPSRLAFQREAYYGARHRALFVGHVVPPAMDGIARFCGVPDGARVLFRGPVHALDITAAYASAMQGNLFPAMHISRPVSITPDRLAGRMEHFAAVARVVIRSPHSTYPRRHKDGVAWNVGRFSTVLCGPELHRALFSGHVLEVQECDLYEQARLFDSFVGDCWRARVAAQKDGRALADQLIKRMMAALHAKFAQRAHKWEDVADMCAPVLWGTFTRIDHATGQAEVYRSLAGHVQRLCQGGEPANSFPLISAYTTAYHREQMREARMVAGEGNVLYECADSLHVTDDGLSNLTKNGMVHDCALGAFRLEGTYQHAEYRGRGYYCLDGEWTRPAISSKAKPEPAGCWRQDEFNRLDAVLDGPPPAGPICHERVVADPHAHIDGYINDQGWIVPWKV